MHQVLHDHTKQTCPLFRNTRARIDVLSDVDVAHRLIVAGGARLQCDAAGTAEPDLFQQGLPTAALETGLESVQQKGRFPREHSALRALLPCFITMGGVGRRRENMAFARKSGELRFDSAYVTWVQAQKGIQFRTSPRVRTHRPVRPA